MLGAFSTYTVDIQTTTAVRSPFLGDFSNRSKMKCVYVFFALTIIAAVNGASDADWEAYKKFYGKEYQQKSFNGQSEDTLRKNQFWKTYAAIQNGNKNHQNLFKQGFNVFSDMFDGELTAMMGAKKLVNEKGNNLITAMHHENRQALPASLDYRTHTCMAPIRNQAACGSCWSFASINPLEFSACNNTATQVLTPLSEQHLIDCDLYDNACNGGWPTNAWYYIQNNNGSAKASSYPYSSAACCTTSCCARNTCSYTASMVGAKVLDFGYIGSSTSNNTALVMQSALLQYGPLAVAITVAPSFMNYMSGVYNDVACDNQTVDHAINIVGFGRTNATACSSGTDYWIIRNSWGTSWGLLGYGMIQRGVNKCSIESYPMAVIGIAA